MFSNVPYAGGRWCEVCGSKPVSPYDHTCSSCEIALRAEVQRGFAALIQYLMKVCAFQDWLARRESSEDLAPAEENSVSEEDTQGEDHVEDVAVQRGGGASKP